MAASAYYDQVEKIYIAYYGRAADTTGLAYWAGQLDAANGNLNAIINAFGNSAESTALYTGSNIDKVTAIYQQLLNRAPDLAGLNFYVAALNAGTMTGASIALDILNGAIGTDATTVANKLAAANAFTAAIDTTAEVQAYQGANAAAAARAWLSTVGSDAASLTAATGTLAATLADIVLTGGTVGTTYTLTTGVDAVPGTSGNDIINAVSDAVAANTTLTGLDDIDGGAGIDTVNVVNVAGTLTINTAATVANVEKLNIVSAANAVTADVQSWTGLQTVTVDNRAATAVNVDTNANATTVVVKGNAANGSDITDNATTGTLASVSIEGAAGAVGVTSTALTSLTLTDADATAAVTVTTASTALTINAVGAAAGAAVIDAGAGVVEALTVNVTADSALALDFAAATSLAVTGSADLALTATDLSAVETLTISGSAAVTADVSGIAALETITATSTGDQDLTIAATALSVTTGAGNDTITQAAALGATQVINTGAGNDTVNLGAVPTAGATVNGGAGTDTIGIAVANIATDHSAFISGFESLAITGALAAALDVDNFDGIQNVHLADGWGAGSSITHLDSGAVITSTDGVAAGALTVSIDNAATGTADALTVNLIPAGADDYGTIDIQDLETLHLNVGSTGADGDNVTIGFAANQDFTTLTLAQATGATKVGDIIIDTALTVVDTVNASGMGAGNVTLSFAGNSGYTYTGAAGVDTITLGELGTVTGGAGKDAYVVSDTANGNTYSTITDLATTETIQFTDGGGYAAGIGAKIALAATAAFADYLQAAAAGTTAGEITWFQYGGDTYIVNDVSADAVFVNGADQIVKLTGLVDLADSAVSAAGLFTYTAV
ncbi:MAG: hypothetical protein H6R04_1394 [Burkholderiaceae bacterium]|nr:hypothetical protein [Burkholderiaceae bacterium]